MRWRVDNSCATRPAIFSCALRSSGSRPLTSAVMDSVGGRKELQEFQRPLRAQQTRVERADKASVRCGNSKASVVGTSLPRGRHPVEQLSLRSGKGSGIDEWQATTPGVGFNSHGDRFLSAVLLVIFA